MNFVLKIKLIQRIKIKLNLDKKFLCATICI